MKRWIRIVRVDRAARKAWFVFDDEPERGEGELGGATTLKLDVDKRYQIDGEQVAAKGATS